MKRTGLVLGAALSLALASGASAANNAYMKISTISGDSTRRGEGGWIEIVSVQWGGAAPTFGAGRAGETGRGGPGSVQFQGARTLPLALRQALESKQRFARVQVEVPKPGHEEVYYKIVLTDVTVSKLSPSSGQFPTETVKMTYGAIEWTYNEPKLPTSLQARPAAKHVPVKAP